MCTIMNITLLLVGRVVKAPKSCHITPILRSIHWLRNTKRIEYKLISIIYKVLTTTHFRLTYSFAHHVFLFLFATLLIHNSLSLSLPA